MGRKSETSRRKSCIAIKDIGNEIDTKFYGVSLSPMKHLPGK